MAVSLALWLELVGSPKRKKKPNLPTLRSLEQQSGRGCDFSWITALSLLRLRERRPPTRGSVNPLGLVSPSPSPRPGAESWARYLQKVKPKNNATLSAGLNGAPGWGGAKGWKPQLWPPFSQIPYTTPGLKGVLRCYGIPKRRPFSRALLVSATPGPGPGALRFIVPKLPACQESKPCEASEFAAHGEGVGALHSTPLTTVPCLASPLPANLL